MRTTATALAALAAAALTLGACGGSSKPAMTLDVATAPTAPVPTCEALWSPGNTIPSDVKWDGVCRSASGVLQTDGGFDCVDGRKLWNGHSVHGRVWAWSGGKVVAPAKPIADDPGYGAAYRQCHG